MPEAATTAPMPIALTIAGSDSSGGAGIQADLKTFTAFGVYGASVITALTAQNTTGVQAVEPVSTDFVVQQYNAVRDDLDVAAIKTGMLANTTTVTAVALALGTNPAVPVVVDPVMVATSGDALLAPEAIAAVKGALLPVARLLTPNLPEAARLLGTSAATSEDEAIDQARALLAMGCRAVLMKGGHGQGSDAVDLLVESDPVNVVRLAAPRLASRHTHGTGCTLSAAITALLALGIPLEAAVRRSKAFVHRAIGSAESRPVGHGHGPVDHLYGIRSAPPPA